MIARALIASSPLTVRSTNYMVNPKETEANQLES